MRARRDQTCAIRNIAQPRLFRGSLRHLYPGSKCRVGNIGRSYFVQPLNGKPDLVFALGAVDVNVDAWQPLNLVLVESKETVCGDSSGWLSAQPCGLLRELDEGKKSIFSDAHDASRITDWVFHTV